MAVVAASADAVGRHRIVGRVGHRSGHAGKPDAHPGRPAPSQLAAELAARPEAVTLQRAKRTRSRWNGEREPRHISIPEAIEFRPEGGLPPHAFYCPPANADFSGLPSDRPPLIVISHGGPTTQTKAALDLQVQFWTSRGFAVVDVNYGGRSGYSPEYPARLNWEWGVVDVPHNMNAAQ